MPDHLELVQENFLKIKTGIFQQTYDNIFAINTRKHVIAYNGLEIINIL